MKFILSFLFVFMLIMPVFSLAKDNIEKVNNEDMVPVLEGNASCEIEPLEKEKIIPIRNSLTNLEYDAKFLKDGKVKKFEYSNIEYSGATDFFDY